MRTIGALDDDEGERLATVGARARIRGFLGASYRPLDNHELIETVLPVMREKGAYLREFNLTDQRLHARFVTFEQSIEDIQQHAMAKFGMTRDQVRGHARVSGTDVAWVNEVIRAGATLRNSETGFATLDVSGFIEILKCLNGLIIPAAVKVRHVGKRGEVEEAEYLSVQTQTLDNAAVFSRVKDALLATLDEKRIAQGAAIIGDAKVERLALPVPAVEWLGNIGTRYQLNDGERALLQEEALRSSVEEGGFTRFAVSQGVTALARQVPDFDRRTEIERIGWEVLTSPTKALLAAGNDPARRN